MRTSHGYKVVFDKETVKIIKEDKIFGIGIKQSNEIYRMLFRVVPNSEANFSVNDLQTWHERAGHVNKRTLLSMVNRQLVEGLDVEGDSMSTREACHLGKAHQLPFTKKTECYQWKVGECFHSDICGPMAVDSLGGSRDFLLFKDDASGYRNVYCVKHKSDTYEKFKEFERLIYNKFNRCMKVLRTDNGGEFCNKNMQEYMKKIGIKHETTAPYTPQQNVRSQRDNRTIVESVRTMLLQKNLPHFLWAEAVNTAVYLLNMTPTSRNPSKSPHEIWTGKKPSFKHLKVFGSAASVFIPKQHRRKLDAKAKKVIFVGYQGDSTNYRLYDPSTRKITVSRNVAFFEKETVEIGKESGNAVKFRFESQEENEPPQDPEREDVEPVPNAIQHQVVEQNLPQPADPDARASTSESNIGRKLRDRSTL